MVPSLIVESVRLGSLNVLVWSVKLSLVEVRGVVVVQLSVVVVGGLIVVEVEVTTLLQLTVCLSKPLIVPNLSQ